MNSKIIYLALSIVAVGLFAIPSTLAVFTRQHTFYGGNDYSASNAVSCTNCHTNIHAELVAGKPHASMTDCKGCHTDGAKALSANKGGDGGSYGGKGATHAAKVNECVVCHVTVQASMQATDTSIPTR